MTSCSGLAGSSGITGQRSLTTRLPAGAGAGAGAGAVAGAAATSAGDAPAHAPTNATTIHAPGFTTRRVMAVPRDCGVDCRVETPPAPPESDECSAIRPAADREGLQ